MINAPEMLECAIIVPTLNERDNVPVLLAALDKALAAWVYEIIFVDDWSKDGTPDTVAALAATRHDVRLIRRYGRRGLSTAVVEGALSTIAPLIAVIDADMQHDESVLPTLLDAVRCGATDVAIGSRYCADGSIGQWDASRAKGSALATRLSHLILKSPVSDPMSGFFAVRRDAVIAALPNLSNMGFKILLDVLASSPTPLKVAEFPYQFRNRHAGESKLDSGVVVDFLMMLLDKKIGRFISPRLIMFGFVGALGLLVHLLVMQTLYASFVHFGFQFTALAHIFQIIDPQFRVIDPQFVIANMTAVLTAIAFNFWLNNNLTYHDKRLRGWKMFTGLLSFYLVCGLGAVANVGVGNVVFGRDHNTIIAAVAGAVVGSAWNFVSSALFTWRKR